ncbi:SusC/RagA family TonB-linked outer membrane protein [Myroides sp. LJL119]
MKSKLLPYYGYSAAMLFIILCCTPTILFANQNTGNFKDNVDQQKIMVTGKITDHSGALPGVVVQIVSTNTATLTDHDGNYTIEVTPGNKLSFSYMGYITKTIEIINQHTLNLTLEQDSKELDEIVVNAGYYTVKDRERTGSIARVTSKDIEFQPVTNPLQAIQGRVAGVDITQRTGLAGGDLKIEIRGRNFLDSGYIRNQPLYIINDIPIISTSQGLDGNALGSQILRGGISPLNGINPADIESIEILKDADATAIYGARGANGVILITTKKNTNKQSEFKITSSIGFSRVANFMNMLKTPDYIKLRELAFLNDNITNYPPNAYDINGTWDKNRYTDWQKELIGNTAIDQNVGLNINGGSHLATYSINYNHNKNKTVFPSSEGYKRNSLNLNFNQRSENNRLHINSSVIYTEQSNTLPIVDLTMQALTLPPNAPALYNSDGSLNWENGTFNNPLGNLQTTYSNTARNLILNTSIKLNLDDNFYFKLNGGISNNDILEMRINPHTAYDPSYGLTEEHSETYKEIVKSNSLIIEPQLHYNYQFKKHHISLLAGVSYQSSKSSLLGLRGNNFPSNAFIEDLSASNSKFIQNDNFQEYKHISVFTRINYTHSNKYIFNITGRRDGSSRFANNYKFGNFGALGVAWVASKENFLKDNKTISFAKLRGSIGVTGSDNIGDYSYLDTYNVNISYNNSISLKPTALYNPNYKWENTKKIEVAIDLSLFKNSINTTLAYYNNRSSDQLIGYTLPATTGFPSIIMNSAAVVENQGWEFNLNTTNIQTQDFSWFTSFNISLPKNKLKSYPGLEEGTQSSIYQIGYPLNITKTYKYNGIDPNTGLYLFEDFNQDGKINSQDKQVLKDLSPKIHGGIQNTLKYKNLSLDFLFSFIKKETYNLDKTYNNTPGGSMTNLPVELLNYITPDNPGGRYLSPTTNYLATTSSMNYRESDAAISDGSFIRLKNINLAYSFNLPQLKIHSLVIYVQGQNLWTITNYYGMDPEFITNGSIPPLKTYSIGLQLTF